MATSNNQQRSGNQQQKPDTSRTSNQGQKLSSGGRKETDNKGRTTSEVIEGSDSKAIKSSGMKM